MPPPRVKKGPSLPVRVLAAAAAVIFTIVALLGFKRSLEDKTGQASPLRALVMLLPAGLLARYAWTGQAKKPESSSK